MNTIAFNQLHFDTSTATGTVFHLMGSLSEFGKLGLTSIGNSPEEAEALYQQVVSSLDRETSDDVAARLAMPFSWPSMF
jgi:hypothetical protein